jgi:hypothetical protein
MTFRWDYTKWSFFDQCPARYHYRYVLREPEGKPSPQLLHGREMHAAAEKLLAGTPWPETLKLHPAAARVMSEVVAHEDRLIEHKITLNRDWQMVKPGGPNVWLTVKMDVAYQTDDGGLLHIIDWKTGKTRAESYSEQLDLYRLTAASIWTAPRIRVAIVNLDDGKVVATEAERADALASKDKWIERATAMETERDFAPKPNAFCQWCPFAASNGGKCRYG